MHVLWLALSVASAQEAACETISFRDIVAVPPPAVIVLGERHGTQPDLARANRVVRQLHALAPVTLALEAVDAENQPVLDRFSAGEIEPEALPSELRWEQTWGFPYGPYERLVTAAAADVRVLAAGTPIGPAPEGEHFPIPAGYIGLLRDAMAGHEMPLEMEERFVRSMAWRDYTIASLATGPWGGDGYLVVVTGRGHVEGGKGVAWQIAQQLPEARIESFVLAWGQAPCYAGDRVWKPGLLEKR